MPSSLAVGLAAAIAGNLCVGMGLSLQKQSLNATETVSFMDGDASIGAYAKSQAAAKRRSFSQRLVTNPALRHQLWWLGTFLWFIGEFGGNLMALSFTSAALVVPLSFISVLTTAVIGHFWLNEKISPLKWRGYVYVLVGVACILTASHFSRADPSRAIATRRQLFELLTPGEAPVVVLAILAIIFAIQFGLVIYVLNEVQSGRRLSTSPSTSFSGTQGLFSSHLNAKKKHYDFVLFVVTIALFNAVAVSCSKFLSTLIRIIFFSTLKEKVAVRFSEKLITTLSMSTFISCIVGQEYFKQLAQKRFPVSKWQPVVFAIFVVLSVFLNTVIFRDVFVVPTQPVAWGGIASFFIGSAIILMGSSWIYNEGDKKSLQELK